MVRLFRRTRVGQLTKLIGLRVPTPILQVELLIDPGAGVDVVATRDPELLEPQAFYQPPGIGEVHVRDIASQDAFEELRRLHDDEGKNPVRHLGLCRQPSEPVLIVVQPWAQLDTRRTLAGLGRPCNRDALRRTGTSLIA